MSKENGVSRYYHQSSPEQKLEALKNLSKENFRGQATSPDWPMDYVRSLRESGHLSTDEAEIIRSRIKKLSKSGKR